MGVVFQGEDPKLGRKVAIKAMLPDLAESKSAQRRFLREARAAAALEHDHIVTIHHVGEERGAPFIVMPLLQGEPLDKRLEHEVRLPLAEVLRIGRQTALGLEAAHKKGLIHRDIKPANIWLEAETDRVKILDFGLARPAVDNAQLTQQGAIIGTPAYMAPEQAMGGVVDARCDLFSLGCVLYRLTTGQPPFKGSDTISTLMSVAGDQPPPPHALAPAVPSGLSDLVMQLLAKKPEDRPGTAQEVAAELAALAEENEIEVPKAGKSKRPARSGGTTKPRPASARRHWPRLAVAAALVLLVGLVGVGLLFTLKSRPGTLVVHVPEGDVQLWIDGEAQGSVDASKVGRLEVLAGEHKLTVKQGAEELYTQTFTVKSGHELVMEAKWTPKRFTNALGMEFVLVPKGKSWLGGGGGKMGDKEVQIPNDFYLGKYVVTQEEWEKVMGNNPSCFSRGGAGKDAVKDIADADLKRFPVEQVSWDDAQLFLGLLNDKDKEAGWVYRLPTEVEWEYACRGGPLANKSESAADFYLDKPTTTFLQAAQANIEDGKGLKRTCKVGSYKANRLGLYDMHGNVWEWCDDLFDPTDPKAASHRVRRGGSWIYDAACCRAAFREAFPPSPRYNNLGLRVARVPVGKHVVAPPPAPPEKKAEGNPPTFKMKLGMEFVLGPKGKSWLDGGKDKPGDKEIEIPYDFYLGKYEVTQEEWEKLMKTNPSEFKAVAGVKKEEQKRFPVEQVSWDDAQTFLGLLNDKEKEAGWLYRLPKEVEWEYACRGGPLSNRTQSGYDFYLDKPTNQITAKQANIEDGNGLKRTCKVGSYAPNALGLYDMQGNVCEWCDDAEKPGDAASLRVFRGGGWFFVARDCRAAYRAAFEPAKRRKFLGLRVSRVPVGVKESR